MDVAYRDARQPARDMGSVDVAGGVAVVDVRTVLANEATDVRPMDVAGGVAMGDFARSDAHQPASLQEVAAYNLLHVAAGKAVVDGAFDGEANQAAVRSVSGVYVAGGRAVAYLAFVVVANEAAGEGSFVDIGFAESVGHGAFLELSNQGTDEEAGVLAGETRDVRRSGDDDVLQQCPVARLAEESRRTC